MESQKVYVLHSPYGNKTWRGLEKCMRDASTDAYLFFYSREEAENALNKMYDGVYQNYFQVVELQLMIPDIGVTCGQAAIKNMP